MSEGTQPEEMVTYYVVRRSLGEPIYRVRALWFRLTDKDLFASAFVAVLLLNLSDRLGWGNTTIFFTLRFNPWGWMGAGFLMASALSLLHKLRPEGHSERILQAFFVPRFYAPRTRRGDRNWRPAPYRALLKLRADGSEFTERLRDRLRKRKPPAESEPAAA
jgi:hypothetical protein